VASVGIDAEPNEATPDGVARTIADDTELGHIAALSAARPDVHWDRLLFSAKESVYKTWFPLTGRWLGFEGAQISIDPEAGTFTARLTEPGPVVGGERHDSFAGRWLVGEGLVLTAIALVP
jgi:4'-phosphopantetheinyl transferase EntD